MTDADVLAIKAYLFSLPAIRAANVPDTLSFPFNQRWSMIFWSTVFAKDARFAPNAGQSAEWNRGAYLAEALAHCGECHTPRNLAFKDKIEKLKKEIVRLDAINAEMMKSEDKQISLTDPDARSMATSGKDTGIVGYNVQAAVDTKNHLIVAHEVTNIGTDRHQLSNIAEQARAEMGVETLDAVADRGYFSSDEILACETAGITVTLPKPMTSNSKAAGRFGKQDFRYSAAEDAYVCPAGQRLAYSFTTEDRGLVLRRYRTNACQRCAIRHSCTTGKERLISRWEHEAVLETVQARLDQHPEKMTMRRQTAEHPFGTIKCWMGATHFLTKRLPKVATEMALNVLAYNMKRVMAIIGVAGLLQALAA
jgi:mono/diheme cytochrome c family protein